MRAMSCVTQVQNHAEALHRALVEGRHGLGRIADPLRILCTKSGGASGGGVVSYRPPTCIG